MATKSAEFSPVIEIDKKGSYLKFAQIAAFFIQSIIEFLSTTSSRRYTEIKQSKKMQSIKIAQHLPIYNKKTPQKIVVFFCLARLKGLEPPTYWFVASHSIQLSYWRIQL